jgi:glycosyltransferase involved in cell wall biosynthesis
LKDKGIREYIQAARLIREKFPDTRFLLAGPLDGNPSAITAAELEQWITEGIIEYLGTLSDVRPALAQASIYVLPSYREGTPRTVLEAMAMGRAIITTDVPGCRETVTHDLNGLLVPHRNVEQLAIAMETLISNPGLRKAYGKKSRIIAEKKYDARLVSLKMIETMGLI